MEGEYEFDSPYWFVIVLIIVIFDPFFAKYLKK